MREMHKEGLSSNVVNEADIEDFSSFYVLMKSVCYWTECYE